MPTLGQQNEEPVMLPVAAFRGWTLSRPDEQHWELIDGVPIMMAPPTLDHQRIASNLERLLNDAIAALPQPCLPPIGAYQRIGVNPRPAVEGHDPEPDVAVVEIPAYARSDTRIASCWSPRWSRRAIRSSSPASGRSISSSPIADASWWFSKIGTMWRPSAAVLPAGCARFCRRRTIG